MALEVLCQARLQLISQEDSLSLPTKAELCSIGAASEASASRTRSDFPGRQGWSKLRLSGDVGVRLRLGLFQVSQKRFATRRVSSSAVSMEPCSGVGAPFLADPFSNHRVGTCWSQACGLCLGSIVSGFGSDIGMRWT